MYLDHLFLSFWDFLKMKRWFIFKKMIFYYLKIEV